MNKTARPRGYFGARRQNLPLIRRQLPPDAWPVTDRSRWDAACAMTDPLTRGGAASHLSPASKKTRAAMWGNFLAFLESIDELEPAEAPEDRVTRDRLTRYIESLKSRVRASTMDNMIVEISFFLKAIAPDHDWSWIRRHPGRPTQADVRASRKPIIPPDPVKALTAALEACDTADGLESPATSAVRFRNAVLMMILICFAPRLKNLAEMRLGEHLIVCPAHLRLVFDETVKNREVIDTPVPDWLAAYVRRYLEVYRPALLNGTAEHRSVWVNIDGAPLQYTVIGHIVREWTTKAGDRAHVHSFRHSLATMLMEQDPRSIEIAAAALAHRGVSSVNQVYDRSGNLVSQKYWLKLLGKSASGGSGQRNRR
jgi:integrase/recombinase XerD